MLRWQLYLLEHKMENPYVEPEYNDDDDDDGGKGIRVMQYAPAPSGS